VAHTQAEVILPINGRDKQDKQQGRAAYSLLFHTKNIFWNISKFVIE
jgi:hypothetical protein